MAKLTLALSLILSITILSGCMNGTAQAPVPSATPTLTRNADCASGCVFQESPAYYFAMRIGPQLPETAGEYTYKLPYSLHVVAIDGWIGTGANGLIQEAESALVICKPNGNCSEYYIELDRHQDVIGSDQRRFPVSIDMPIGTTVTVRHNGGYCPQGQCGYDTIWRFYSE